MTRDLVLDDPDVTTSPMINPFANTKKKGKKGNKTPKSTGTKKKPTDAGMNSDEEQDGPDTFDRRADNSSKIKVEGFSNNIINSNETEQVV